MRARADLAAADERIAAGIVESFRKRTDELGLAVLRPSICRALATEFTKLAIELEQKQREVIQ